MNTVLLAIIAFGSIFSVTRHIIDEVQHYRWKKKADILMDKQLQEWEDRL